jgi:hypothetical protein
MIFHEKIDARSRRADHFGERVLRNLRDHLPRLLLLAVPCQQQQRPRQPLFAGVEQLIDQVLLDPHITGQHVRDEAIR